MEDLSSETNDDIVKSEGAQGSSSAPEEALRRLRRAGSFSTANSVWYTSGADIKYFHYQSRDSWANLHQVFIREHGGLAKYPGRRLASGT